MRKINFTKGELTVKIVLSIFIVSIFCFTAFCQNLILGMFGVQPYNVSQKSDFQICFVDVGQGDCTYIEYKGVSFLIDCGDDIAISNTANVIEKIGEGREIDFFVLTHADSDHTGGADEIFERFKIKNFIRPKMTTIEEVEKIGNENNYALYDTDAYSNAISSAYNEKDCKISYVNKGKIFSNEEFCVEILYPFSDEDLDSDDTNTYSAVIKVIYKDFSYLLMADSDVDVEERLIFKYKEELNCDVLKVSHHGSNDGTSEMLLKATSPSYAIVSVGEAGLKDYGHAGEEFCDRLEKYGVLKCQTSELGNIMFANERDEQFLTFKEILTLPISIISAICIVIILFIWALKGGRREKNR